MPKKIDRIGRSHEWCVIFLLTKDKLAEKKMKEYMEDLNDIDIKRVLIASKKAAEKIVELNQNKKICGIKYVGEKNKKTGMTDFDIVVKFYDGTEVGYSLKLQSSFSGVNVRNPTLNSLCKHFTGRNFEEFLDEKEKKKYSKLGELYINGKIDSKEIGKWGAKKLAEILSQCLKENPNKFLDNLYSELRYGTNLILTVVDKSGKFIGQSTQFSVLFEFVRSNPLSMKIKSKGISVYVKAKDQNLIHIDLYMMSDSKGLKNKLRAAIRIDFEIDKYR